MQKLRKKAGMVSTDAVDVYVGVADASAPSSFQSLLAGVLEAQVRGKEKIVLWLSGALSVDLVGGLFSLTEPSITLSGFSQKFINDGMQCRSSTSQECWAGPRSH